METKRKIHSTFNKVSAVCMILALLWLTVSTPFVFAAQQELAKQHKMEKSSLLLSGNEEETTNPFGNNTEEKTSSTNSFSEEYLHDHHIDEHLFSVALQYHKCEDAGTYIAFHGELLVPPPNAA